jgi:uncharacterized protein (DUF4213/DUF364 family)
MSFRSLLKKLAISRADKLVIKDVRIGVVYTAVQLDNDNVGLAYTFRDRLAGGCSVYASLGELAGRPAKDLLALFDREGEIESALALATANAIFNTSQQDYKIGPSVEQVSWLPSDRVAMVGHFQPLVTPVTERAKKLLIFEQQARPEDNILGIEEATRFLPNCQVALITSTALINNTIDDLMPLASHCREVLLIGPSTPLASEILNATPVTCLSGVVVKDADKVLQLVSEGAGVPSLKRYMSKVNLARNDESQDLQGST